MDLHQRAGAAGLPVRVLRLPRQRAVVLQRAGRLRPAVAVVGRKRRPERLRRFRRGQGGQRRQSVLRADASAPGDHSSSLIFFRTGRTACGRPSSELHPAPEVRWKRPAMTERKPPDLSFTSWIDRQINEAAERGAFDNLPGAGKPLPKRTDADAAQAWLRDYARREGVSADELLPTPLRRRKEIERPAERVQDLPSEREVRAVVADLNRRVIEWRRIPTGPPVFLPLLEAEPLVGRWHDAHPAPPPPPPSPVPAPAPPTRRWRRRRRMR